jgi:hypothetical protein
MASKSKESAGDDIAGITPGKAKNAVKVAKVLAPAVLPVVAPYAAQAAAFARDRYDRMRARRLGIAVDELGEYSGKGAGLQARINGVRGSLVELMKRDGERDEEFAKRAGSTADNLATAVRAAERMPAPRRKAAHRAVSAELDRLEAELLTRLGV